MYRADHNDVSYSNLRQEAGNSRLPCGKLEHVSFTLHSGTLLFWLLNCSFSFSFSWRRRPQSVPDKLLTLFSAWRINQIPVGTLDCFISLMWNICLIQNHTGGRRRKTLAKLTSIMNKSCHLLHERLLLGGPDNTSFCFTKHDWFYYGYLLSQHELGNRRFTAYFRLQTPLSYPPVAPCCPSLYLA